MSKEEQRLAQLDDAFSGALNDVSHSVIALGGHSRILLNRSNCEESIVHVIKCSMALGGIASAYNKELGKESTFSTNLQELLSDAVNQAIAGKLKSLPPRELSDEEFDSEMKKRAPEAYEFLSQTKQFGGIQAYLATLMKEPSIDEIEDVLLDDELSRNQSLTGQISYPMKEEGVDSDPILTVEQVDKPLSIGFNCDDAEYLLNASDVIGSTIPLPVMLHNPHEQNVKFDTSEPTVLRVNETTGELTAVKVGSASITVTLSKKGDHKRIQSSLDVRIDG
ncbi:Ig-like domain-containing protein [Aliivibrio finisterrensis]|uniref:Ig-like domain-containing protein n=1 Tax=Aliivibrio finisterrensis TaxID=511998 RepID=A0A4Q5K7Y5_9GAMM|nr:Ig-like domain-containing protein [Aliivibrio finisterrensis]RYU41898.1 Ig-like domain-containing protein [Aliivibrio finisterrensis]